MWRQKNAASSTKQVPWNVMWQNANYEEFPVNFASISLFLLLFFSRFLHRSVQMRFSKWLIIGNVRILATLRRESQRKKVTGKICVNGRARARLQWNHNKASLTWKYFNATYLITLFVRQFDAFIYFFRFFSLSLSVFLSSTLVQVQYFPHLLFSFLSLR